MDYHILDLYTLKSMTRDFQNEIDRLGEKIEAILEQKEIIDMIIEYRNKKQKKNPDNEIWVDPL